MISKFIETLQTSQKNWAHIQDELKAKVRKAEDLLRCRMDVDAKNLSVYTEVAMLS